SMFRSLSDRPGTRANRKRCGDRAVWSLSCPDWQLGALAPTRFHDISVAPTAAEDGGGEPPPKFLLHDIGQQTQEAGAFDRLGEFALLFLADGRDAGRYDLAA